ncbi:MAG: NAD(P)H-binding protein [Pirellulaceae bacterium]|nr:NAD(P)H-binding protein [Pirellulaceae bacterium]
MSESQLHVVTGAFGYSGKYIARRLLDAGHSVRTLTASIHRRNPFGGAVEVHPYRFDRPDAMADSLRGAAVLYNTYWVRFNHKGFRHDEAVRNTLALFEAAQMAGVPRVVHVSIANPSEDSPLEYYRGKARLERALVESRLSHAILRPTVLFGKEDILINNIAWSLRRFPVMGIFGDGRYRIQPVYVDDLARLAVEQGGRTENCVVNAVGPETFAYRELVETIGRIIGRSRRLIGLPPALCYLATRMIGAWLGDVIITRGEVKGLMAGLLAVDSSPTGTVRLTDWAKEHADELGRHYASELARRKNREAAYEQL